jgi:PhzF family phenazine biosynthesis protein
MGLHVEALHPTLEPWASHDQHMLYVPLKSLPTLERITPDFTKLGRLERDANLLVVPFALETFDPDHLVHLRCFAPGVGIDEDPVTGAANAPLGVLLFQQGVLPLGTNPTEYIAEQGDFVSRSGRVYVRVHHENGKVSAVQIGGEAVKVLEGDMYL